MPLLAGEPMNSRLKYSRNALHINVLLLLIISDSALLPLSATGGGRKATPTVRTENLFHKQTIFPTAIFHFQFYTFNF